MRDAISVCTFLEGEEFKGMSSDAVHNTTALQPVEVTANAAYFCWATFQGNNSLFTKTLFLSKIQTYMDKSYNIYELKYPLR